MLSAIASENSVETSTLPVYTTDEVSKHNKNDDAWVSLQGLVYDITDYIQDESNHPGGMTLVREWLGKDISQVWKDESVHVHTEEALAKLGFYLIGRLVEAKVIH